MKAIKFKQLELDNEASRPEICENYQKFEASKHQMVSDSVNTYENGFDWNELKNHTNCMRNHILGCYVESLNACAGDFRIQ